MIDRLASRTAAIAAVVVGITAVAVGVGGVIVGGGIFSGSAAPAEGTAGPAAATPPQAMGRGVPAPTITDLALPSPPRRTARPVALLIPAIGVNTPLVNLGLTPAGTIEVPAGPAVAGWYVRSPRPGAIGSSVIIGHVDWRHGPAVFFRLSHLRPGARVYVRRADRSLAVFQVNAVHMYEKSRFPTAAVYGPTPDAELRLVTCGGAFDHILKSYLSNVVVYAAAVT